MLGRVGLDWEVSLGLGMVPSGSKGEHAGSFYMHGGAVPPALSLQHTRDSSPGQG